MKSENAWKKWFGGFLLLLLITVFLPFLISWRMHSTLEEVQRQMPSPMGKISKDTAMGLSDGQTEKIMQLEKLYEKKIMECCGRHCSARMNIGELLKTGSFPREALLKLGAETTQATQEAEMATLQHVLDVCDVLNPEQRKKYLKKVSSHISATCPSDFKGEK